jgi:hypothetical protein
MWLRRAAFAKREAPLDNARMYPLAAGPVLSSASAAALGQVVIGAHLKKLVKFKAWLTLPETARYLSIVLGEDVTEADVLRLALDEHLELSVNFVNGASAQCNKIAKDEPPHVQSVNIEMSDEEAARWFEELRIVTLDEPEEYGNGLVF